MTWGRKDKISHLAGIWPCLQAPTEKVCCASRHASPRLLFAQLAAEPALAPADRQACSRAVESVRRARVRAGVTPWLAAVGASCASGGGDGDRGGGRARRPNAVGRCRGLVSGLIAARVAYLPKIRADQQTSAEARKTIRTKGEGLGRRHTLFSPSSAQKAAQGRATQRALLGGQNPTRSGCVAAPPAVPLSVRAPTTTHPLKPRFGRSRRAPPRRRCASSRRCHSFAYARASCHSMCLSR